MSFDWDEYDKLSDEEKAAYLDTVEDAALEASQGETFPPGALGLEKGRHPEGLDLVGYEKPDGTIHYYTEDEKRALSADDQQDADDEDSA
ncbi:hypothetical protein [Jiangella asiatica]|uniref:Uncharacterized protein n=1 Tax=Jiangella asiatica TaxID=2530372 RepID=A0A4R5CKR6_9ACTN|nr:hypothetical protein [Jiangella asiatica]TDE00902.1 hypothetical protein E1269_24215 [Jiangella asiatica]